MSMRALVSVCAAATFALVAAGPIRAQLPATQAGQTTTTFNRDVLPILQKNCQGCHRPGEIGPMPLLTYAQARPYARAIKTATQSKKMPPWFADSSVQHYANDMSLPAADISTLAAWADAGAPEGDPKDAPAARAFVDGWNIGTPDKVVQMPEAYHVPADGTIEYTYIILPTHFTEDTWVQALEIRPGNRSLMHHAVSVRAHAGFEVAARIPGRRAVCAGAAAGEEAAVERRRSHLRRLARRRVAGRLRTRRAAVYAAGGHGIPRQGQLRFRPAAALYGERHGGNGPDTHRRGAGEDAARQARVRRACQRWAIRDPAGRSGLPGDRLGDARQNVELLSAGPHMHLRGKAMDLRAVYPGGQSEMLFHVPRYDFNWQQLYQFHTARTAPRGTKLDVVGVWDNSTGNRFNPDPRAEVHWGDQSWEEMLLAIVTMLIDPKADVTKLFEAPTRASEERAH